MQKTTHTKCKCKFIILFICIYNKNKVLKGSVKQKYFKLQTGFTMTNNVASSGLWKMVNLPKLYKLPTPQSGQGMQGGYVMLNKLCTEVDREKLVSSIKRCHILAPGAQYLSHFQQLPDIP